MDLSFVEEKRNGRDVVLVVAERRFFGKYSWVTSVNIHFNTGPSLTLPSFGIESASRWGHAIAERYLPE